MIRKKHTLLAALAGLALAAGSTHGTLLVYEGFDYPAATIDGTQNGGTGFDGGWTGSGANNLYAVLSSGLTFDGLTTTGGAVKRPSAPQSAEISRTVDSTVASTLTQDNSTIWFSVLVRTDFFAGRFANDAMVFGTGAFTNLDTTLAQMAGGSAVGVTLLGGNQGGNEGSDTNTISIHGFTINNGVSATSTTFIDQGVQSFPATTYMIVGRIDWAADGTDDTISFYNILDPTAELPAPFATMTADLDQSAFDTIAIGSQQVATYDEIRFGTTLESVGVTPPAPAPESSFQVVITPAVAPATGFDLEWESQSGKLYNLYTSTDLAGPINTWTLLEDDIEATPPANVKNVPEDGPRRFYAVEEFDAPPPPPLFSADFEDDDGGFTVVTTGTGSTWQHGEPDSADLGGGFDVTTGNDGSAQAWGVNLTGAYATDTVTSLRSPAINLGSLSEGTGAALEFALAIDIASDASLVVRVIEEVSDNVIGDPVLTISGQTMANWDGLGPFPLPVEAIGEVVRIEWLFTGPDGSIPFLGVYLDDVVVTETNP